MPLRPRACPLQAPMLRAEPQLQVPFWERALVYLLRLALRSFSKIRLCPPLRPCCAERLRSCGVLYGSARSLKSFVHEQEDRGRGECLDSIESPAGA